MLKTNKRHMLEKWIPICRNVDKLLIFCHILVNCFMQIYKFNQHVDYHKNEYLDNFLTKSKYEISFWRKYTFLPLTLIQVYF
jgi:hypothetical protein